MFMAPSLQKTPLTDRPLSAAETAVFPIRLLGVRGRRHLAFPLDPTFLEDPPAAGLAV
jgi:hypothetical protein